jgi:hypothetical protein
LFGIVTLLFWDSYCTWILVWDCYVAFLGLLLYLDSCLGLLLPPSFVLELLLPPYFRDYYYPPILGIIPPPPVWGVGGVGSLLTFDIPQTALVATLDTYDFIIIFYEFLCCFLRFKKAQYSVWQCMQYSGQFPAF